MSNTAMSTPAKGLAGLKQNWKTDIVSGFLVFLLALPLSLGIAKASGFPAAMGVLTAIVGGLFVSFYQVSQLTIKGPAAGLITVCAGSITAFGGGETGWQMTCAVIIVFGILQIFIGFLKLGSLSDFFPYATVHGMLAAIGIIIITKQIPVLLGDDPIIYKGESPIQLLLGIPKFIENAHWHVAMVGIIGLVIMFSFPFIKNEFIRKIPAPMLVLLISVPIAILWHFREDEPQYALVKIGDIWGSVGLNVDFSGIGTFSFWKYVLMFLFVNSLESLLTVKAVDDLDPYGRKSNPNGDLVGVGAGNALSGLLGGLPMISEVVRSGANVGFGAKTKWSNFFHGVFLLLAMLMMIPVIELIPNSALAAMLIYAGYRLAAPSEFIKTYKIGSEHLVIFLVTIVVTIAQDLLMGVAAGVLTKLIFHLVNGVPLRKLFKVDCDVQKSEDLVNIHVRGAAIFSNLIGYKKLLMKLPPEKAVMVDFSECALVDHSFMEFLQHHTSVCNKSGLKFEVIGLHNHRPYSKHPLATRERNVGFEKDDYDLPYRTLQLFSFAVKKDFVFQNRADQFDDWHFYRLSYRKKILAIDNVINIHNENHLLKVADVTVEEGARQDALINRVTVLKIEGAQGIPEFYLHPTTLSDRIKESLGNEDIDFDHKKEFSDKYVLRGFGNEKEIRTFFTDELIDLINEERNVFMSGNGKDLVFYYDDKLLNIMTINRLVRKGKLISSMISRAC